MSYQVPLMNLGVLVAASDLSAKTYYLCKLNTSGKVALCGAGENALGAIINEPAANEAVSIGAIGVYQVICGGTVTADDNLMSDANGKAVTQTGSNAVIGVALKSGVSGDIIPVFFANRTGVGVSTTYSIWSIPVPAMSLLANGDYLTTFTPGFPGKILNVSFAVTTAVTTADKAATLNFEINTTNLTGGVISLTSANCTPLGAVVAGTAITANNTFDADDTISVEASSVTAFSEGAGVIYVTLASS